MKIKIKVDDKVLLFEGELFTGLIDEEGNEIYTGDIILKDNKLHQVVWLINQKEGISEFTMLELTPREFIVPKRIKGKKFLGETIQNEKTTYIHIHSHSLTPEPSKKETKKKEKENEKETIGNFDLVLDEDGIF